MSSASRILNTKNVLGFLLAAFSFFFPHFLGIIFIYPLMVLAAIWFFLKYVSNERFSDLFFSFGRFKGRSIAIGLICAIALSVFFQFVWDPFVDYLLPNERYDLSDFALLKGNTTNYVILLFLALLAGGFYEEIVFHGFLFTRLESIFDFKNGTVVSFVLTNAIFGLYHY